MVMMMIQLSENYWRRVCTKILEEALALIFSVQREVKQSARQASDETSSPLFWTV
jgi:hypothetical protein